MSIVLAAVDNSEAAAPVIEAARALAAVIGARVEALHVQEDGVATASTAAEDAGIPIRVASGDPVVEVIRAVEKGDVVLAVVGARGETSAPTGHLATEVVQRVHVPVVVVSPEARLADVSHPVRRALVPLDGTEESADALAAALHQLAGSGVDLVALHVFGRDGVPRFWDHEGGHAEQTWASEFMQRWCAESGAHLRLRRGPPSDTVVDVAAEERVDLIAMAWGQDLTPGRADVVRTALTRATVPVMLVPVEPGGRRP